MKLVRLIESQEYGTDFVDRFIEAANHLTSFKTRATLGGFDSTAFHITTKIKHLLVGFSTSIFERQIARWREAGNEAAVARLKAKRDPAVKAIRFIVQKIADYVSNLPQTSAMDLRTYQMVDPYTVLKEFFPDGEPGHLEDDIRQIGMVISSLGGSKQDVHNLMELADMNGLKVSDEFKDEMAEWYHGKSREEVSRENSEIMRSIMNPEFNDVTKTDNFTLSTRIDNDSEEGDDEDEDGQN